MLNNEAMLVIVSLAVLFVAVLIPFIVALTLLPPWLQAFMAGVPIRVFELIGMRLRRIDVNAVLRAAIMAHQSGADVSLVDLQRAYLRGVDLEKITLAHIEAHKKQLGLKFEELVELDLQDRLAEKLKG